MLLSHRTILIPQAKLLRVFKLIRLLNQQPGRTISQLAESVDLTERSVYRYIRFLEEVGYSIDSHPVTNRYFLAGHHSAQSAALTEEESDLIRQALTGVAMSNPLLTAIRQKLFLGSTLLPLADGLTNMHQAQVVSQLAEGIREGVQVRLLRYHSANSNTITDRLVEPLAFTDGYATLEAYEPVSDTVKIFKTKRIEAIELTEQPSSQHPSDTVQDLFDWTGPCWLPVDLHLSHRAYCLLIEEYPAARSNTYERPSESPLGYGWRGRVRDWRGIGRFVLGLPGDVAVIQSDSFRAYLQGRLTEFIF